MKVNLKSFSVTRSMAQDGRMRLSMRVAFMPNPNRKIIPYYGDRELSPMLHCEQHIEEFTARLRGHVPFMAAHVFEDGTQYLQPSPTGIVFLVHDGSMTARVRVRNDDYPDDSLTDFKYVDELVTMAYQRFQLVFPGAAIADLIDKTKLSFKVKDLSDGVTENIDEKQAAELRYKFRERARIVFANDRARRRFHQTLKGPDAESFKHCVLVGTRGCKNMSMGNMVHLEVYTDGPKSFGWSTWDAECDGYKAATRFTSPVHPRAAFCGNGGWIRHVDKDGTSRGFSTHT